MFNSNVAVRSAILGLALLGTQVQAQIRPSFQPDPAEQARQEEARRRSEKEDLRRLHEKMQSLANAWNAFVGEYVERGTFNLKKARAINEAWRKLERDEFWPKK